MKRIVLLLVLTVSPVFAQSWSPLTVDLLVPMNTSTPGTALTSTIMQNGTVSDCSGCTWASPPAGNTVGSFQPGCANIGAVTVNGVTYPTGSLTYNSIAHADSANGTVWNFNFSNKPTNLSIGACIKLGMPGQPNGNDYDYWMVQDLAGNFALLQFTNNCGSGNFATRIEIDGGVTSGCINVATQGTYYFSLYINSTANTSSLYVFTTAGVQVGKASLGGKFTGPLTNVRIVSNENGTDSGTTYMQNLMMNWNTAPNPLFWTPGALPEPPTNLSEAVR